MISWWVVGIIIIMALFLVRIKHIKHKVIIIGLIAIILFIYLTSSQILAGEDIDLKTLSGIEKATGIYFSWIANSFENLKVLTTQAIGMDWKITNSTAKTIKNKP